MPMIVKQLKTRKKAKIRNQYNQVPHLIQNTSFESDKNTRNYHMKESKEVSPFPPGDRKAGCNEQTRQHDRQEHNNKKDPQMKPCLGTVSKHFFTGELN